MKWCWPILHMLLASVFIVAGVGKLIDPTKFAVEIEHYRLISGTLAELLALYLPWLEVIAGAALLRKPSRRPAGLVLLGLMLVFTMALSEHGLRGVRFRARRWCGRWLVFWRILLG